MLREERTRIAQIARIFIFHTENTENFLFVSLVRFVFKNKSTVGLESSVDSMPL